MVSPVARRLLAYGSLGLGIASLTLVLLQTLLAQRLERSRIEQLGGDVAFSLNLGSLALESLPPTGLAQVTGLRLAVGRTPAGSSGLQARQLRAVLCRRLAHCPSVRVAPPPEQGLWVEMVSPLEQVWLFVPLPGAQLWPPDATLLAIALLAGGLVSMLLVLTLEVDRPLRQLELALARGGDDLAAMAAALQALPDQQGTPAVRRLVRHTGSMLERLRRAAQDRSEMLAGIAHDLRSPLTRLRLRLSLNGRGGDDRSSADLDALERITDQFLVFARGEQAELAVQVPLAQLLAEVAASYGDDLELDLVHLERWVRPIALERAVANLLDNSRSHGWAPFRLSLGPWGGRGQGFEIQVWDGGRGISAEAWDRALQPFNRLDPARGGAGHAGLGLAIAQRVTRAGGGELVQLRQPPPAPGLNFGVAIRFGSLPRP